MQIPVISDFIEAIKIAINPSANTKTNLSSSKVMALYYKSLVLPLVATVIASLYIYRTPTALYNWAIVVDSLVFIPIALLLIYAALHIVGARIFKYAKEDSSRTLVSVFYTGASYVSIQLIWNTIKLIFKITGSTSIIISGIVIYVWMIAVLVVIYSKEQKISKKEALYSVLAAGILFAILIAILGSLFFSFTNILI
jgi:hypothetical protein